MPPPDAPDAPSSPDRMASMLAALWTRAQPQLLERLTLLDHAATACVNGTLNPQARAEAHATAHKLAGILGTFGFPEGTDLARQLEHDFDPASTNDPAATIAIIVALRTLLFPHPERVFPEV